MSALLRNLSSGLDAARSLVEQDGFYATFDAVTYIEELNNSTMRLAQAAEDAIARQVEERGS